MKLASVNARVETVTTKPFFREPFQKKRCLMPASGYYEWQDTESGKQPWYSTARDGSPLLTVVGHLPRDPRAHQVMRGDLSPSQTTLWPKVHDRMPVLLQPEQFDRWLSGDMDVEELRPAPNEYLQRWVVSKRVNSSKDDKDDATLIEAHQSKEANDLLAFTSPVGRP